MPIYLAPKALRSCWRKPLGLIGCQCEDISHTLLSCTRDIADEGAWKIKRDGKECKVCFETDHSFYLFVKGPLFRRGNNHSMAEVVERTLLASGAIITGCPYSTDLVYRVNERPDRAWFKQIGCESFAIHFAREPASIHGTEAYLCGKMTSTIHSIRFWTGPAIEPESQQLFHYVALGASASKLKRPRPPQLLQSIDVALTCHGALRLEVRLSAEE